MLQVSTLLIIGAGREMIKSVAHCSYAISQSLVASMFVVFSPPILLVFFTFDMILIVIVSKIAIRKRLILFNINT